MAEFTMPALGADMTEGTLLEWLVRPGDRVDRGDIVAVVDTAKAAIEVECFETGTVEKLLVEPGTVVPVGAPLAVIAAAADTAADTDTAVAGAPAGAPSPGTGVQPTEQHAQPVATPLVRRLAEAGGVDLAAVHGTGPGGRVTKADVEAAPHTSAEHPEEPAAAGPSRARSHHHAPSEPGPPTAAEGASMRIRATPMARRIAEEAGLDLTLVRGSGVDGVVRAADVRAALHPAETEEPRAVAEPPRTAGVRAEAMRQAVGALMDRSKREIPHYYLSTTVDLAEAVRWLRDRNRRLPVSDRLVPAALMLKAAAVAAREVPQLNGWWTDGFTPAPAVHLGVAVSLRGGGLIAPAIRDAADLPLPELMARLRDLVARARAGRLRGSETSDPSITVTSLGDQGVEAVFGVIYPPQVALVGLGKVVERPWAADGMLGVRPVVTATLSADHRASDGATGARYLSALDRLLQQPEEL
ncbi:dihydrolipoamide acetyltransferase family protein [Kitasatospora sp. NPDC085879]|uniref:dihydrolipoamide acetyltransferase family protein n=1 Tax=Kitasatospora sp. NPDC085879 TaxID=3154769 RepID=UPI003418481F